MYKVEVKGNYFYLTDENGRVETEHSKYVIGEQISGTNNMAIKLTGTAYNDKPLTPSGGVLFSNISDSTDTAFASMAALKTWFENNTGKSKAVTAVSVADFGAVGDGVTDDLPSFEAAAAAATRIGTKLIIPDGYYRITGTWNIGLIAYTEFDFMVNRTNQTLDTDFNTYDIPANEIINRDNYEAIDIEASKGAFIVADWLPTNPEPVVSYNLETDRDKGRRAEIKGLQIISAEVFSGGVHAPISINTPVTNNLIGLFYSSKVNVVDNILVSGCGYGIVAENPYWNQLKNVKVEWAKECVNVLQGNAFTANNFAMWNSNKGVIFNGSASTLTGIHTEQVTEEFWHMGGDANYFGQMYLEDVGVSSATGLYAFKIGVTEDGNEAPHNIYEGIRINGGRPKGGMRVWSAGKSTFTGNRVLGKSNLFDTFSNGNSINNDFTMPSNFKTITVQKTGTAKSNQVATWDADGIILGTDNFLYDETTVKIGGSSSIIQNGVATPNRNSSQYYIKTNAPRVTNNFFGMIGAGESDTSVNAGMFSFDAGGSAAVGLSFWTGNNSGISEKLRIDTTGNIKFPTVGAGLVLKSPDGTEYLLTVNNGGTINIVAN